MEQARSGRSGRRTGYIVAKSTFTFLNVQPSQYPALLILPINAVCSYCIKRRNGKQEKHPSNPLEPYRTYGIHENKKKVLVHNRVTVPIRLEGQKQIIIDTSIKQLQALPIQYKEPITNTSNGAPGAEAKKWRECEGERSLWGTEYQPSTALKHPESSPPVGTRGTIHPSPRSASAMPGP